MTTVSLICAILFSFYIFTGLYIISRNPGSAVHVVFFIMTIFLALWALPAVYLYSSEDPEVARRCIHIGSIGIILFVPAIFHFSLIITPFVRFRRFFYVLYLPFVLFAARNIHTPLFFTDLRFEQGLWRFSPDFNSPWHRAYSMMAVAYILTSIFILFRWYLKAGRRREKRQAFIIALSLALTTALIVSEEIMFPALFADFTPGLAPLTFIILMAGIFYSILRYGFLDVSVALAADDILATIDESIVLIDTGRVINVINRKTEQLLGLQRPSLRGKDLISFLDEGDEISLRIQDLVSGQLSSVFARFHYRGNSSPVLVDAKMTPMLDNTDEVIGVLIVARESKKGEFIERFGITPREFEVLLQILKGKTNREIAHDLNIREITVKTHITHIYEKLGVDNRVKLLEILKDYHILQY